METRDVPASVAQRLLWMMRHYRSDLGAMNCPVLCRVDGKLDVDALQRALDDLVRRHESLRTTFRGGGARLTQCVHPATSLPITLLEGEPDVAAEVKAPIDPTVWPARATLWRRSEQEHVLCLNLHHLVTDAWSTGLLLRDLRALYERATGTPAELPPTGWPYAEFSTWQRELLTSDRLSRHRDYWKRQLSGAAVPDVRSLGPGGETDGSGAGVRTTDIDPAVVALVRELARQHHTTLFTVLLAAFFAHLRRATGQADLAVASMFANRSRPELRETVGLLANMVLLRARLDDARTFAELIRQTHATVIGAFTYQDLPLQMLPADIVDAGGGLMDDVVFNVMAELDHTATAGDVRFELLVPHEIGGRFRFELVLAPVGPRELRALLFYTTDWLDVTTAEDFLSGYITALSALARHPHEPL